MLSNEEANAQAEAILREARAGWPRNKPLVNLLPLYYRMCPELRQFDQVDAFAIVRMANRAVVAHPGMTMLFQYSAGALIGIFLYRFPHLLWAGLPLALAGMSLELWRVRRQVALICARLTLEK